MKPHINCGVRKENVNPKKIYQFRVEVPDEFRPVQSVTKTRHVIDEDALRAQGARNIDLWAKGHLYPRDPLHQIQPKFECTTDLIKFIGMGNVGLLGYCKNLAHGSSNELAASRNQQLEAINSQLQASNHHLQCHFNGLLKQNAYLSHSCSILQKQVDHSADTQAKLEQQLLVENQKAKRLLEENEKLEQRLKRLKETPLGQRERHRPCKPIHLLVGGGAAKKRVAAIKTLVDPSLCRKSKTFCSKTKRNEGHLAELLKKISTKEDILRLINLPGANHLRKELIEVVIGDLHNSISAENLQTSCDNFGVSRRAYLDLFKTLKVATKNMGVSKSMLPNLTRIWACRSDRNRMVKEMLGDMIHIDACIDLNDLDQSKKRSKNISETAKKFILNKRNNCWLDVENVLRLMVRYYDIRLEESSKLLFVIKLDEMEMIKGEKYERVSITLMNRALGSDACVGKETFSVQSEEHIWWIGIFQVSKECHSILKWVFNQTPIPALIASHAIGVKLEVPGYGEYDIEWHLAADLKTIKCMYNMKHGAGKTIEACPFCNFTPQEKASKTGKAAGSGQTYRSTLCCDQNSAPSRQFLDNSLDPILPIELTKVHICTLHAFLRIVDKMVYLSILFAWNKTLKSDKDNSLAAIEKVLSDMGLHGRNYKIVEDPKNKSVPSKPSMGGVKARKFLPSVDDKAKGKWEWYRELLAAEDDRTANGKSYENKMKAWHALFPLFKLLIKKRFTEQDKEDLRTYVTAFTKAFIAAWGDKEVTHYIHILYAHTPWFAKEYGSLGIWSTQGMEKSHKQAKNAYFRCTSHGGGQTMSSPLQQMSEWFYRRIIAKLAKKESAAKETSLASILRENMKKRRSDAWHRSSAAESQRKWRVNRKRYGKRYIEDKSANLTMDMFASTSS